jgi:hypothetical protein
VVTGRWLDYDFLYIGNVIIPTDKLHFSRWLEPSTSYHYDLPMKNGDFMEYQSHIMD